MTARNTWLNRLKCRLLGHRWRYVSGTFHECRRCDWIKGNPNDDVSDDEPLSGYEKLLLRGHRRRHGVTDAYDHLINGSAIGCWILFIAFDIAVAIAIYSIAFDWWTG